jgi:hypothetical protein
VSAAPPIVDSKPTHRGASAADSRRRVGSCALLLALTLLVAWSMRADAAEKTRRRRRKRNGKDGPASSILRTDSSTSATMSKKSEPAFFVAPGNDTAPSSKQCWKDFATRSWITLGAKR